jgi:uncharacterized membrane protein YdfJ with MMPL/SSD domain
VDAVTDDHGQALALAVLALAIAAVTIVGLRGAQERILADAHERRAGEAAIEAAGAALADAQLSLTGQSDRAPTQTELEALASDPLVRERALAAANALSLANDGPPARDLSIDVGARTFELALAVGSHRQRAAIETRCCRR